MNKQTYTTRSGAQQYRPVMSEEEYRATHDAGVGFEPIHGDKQLVEGLFAYIVDVPHLHAALAAKAGISPGDVIAKVGNAPVKTAGEASDLINKKDLKKGVRLYVTTPEGSRFVFIEGE